MKKQKAGEWEKGIWTPALKPKTIKQYQAEERKRLELRKMALEIRELKAQTKSKAQKFSQLWKEHLEIQEE